MISDMRLALPRPRIRLPRLPNGFARKARGFAEAPGPRTGIVLCVVAATALLAAAAVAFAAQQVQGQHTRERAAEEAVSSAQDAGWTATGDAFSGYVQLLRAAEDPDVQRRALPSDRRTQALRRLLELNTNRFSALAVVGLDGALVSASGPEMLNAPLSDAFAIVRANRGNANSDIVIGEGNAYVDYASILQDPSGEQWGVLVARAQASELWQTTLASSVDGSRSMIINGEGVVAAAAGAAAGAGAGPAAGAAAGANAGDAGTGSPWRGRPWLRDTVRTQIGGVDAICGLAPIARDTQIDHDWTVASCLPAARVLGGTSMFSPQVLLAAAAALLLALTAAVLVVRRFGGAAAAVEQPDLAGRAEPAEPEPVDEPPPAAPDPIPETDAQLLIDSYEERNGRLALRVRESVQARLLVASSRVEEAIELMSDDPELADAMLRRAAQEIDDVNTRELRAFGQELHPDLVRLGLPAALRALKKDVADEIEIEVDADTEADGPDGDEATLGRSQRIALYRLVLDAARLAAHAGIATCEVTLRAVEDGVWARVRVHGDVAGIDTGPLRPAELAIEAFGGELAIDHAVDSLEIVATFEREGGDRGPAPAPAPAPENEDAGQPEAALAGDAGALQPEGDADGTESAPASAVAGEPPPATDDAAA